MRRRKGDSYLGGHTIWPVRFDSPLENDLGARKSIDQRRKWEHENKLFKRRKRRRKKSESREENTNSAMSVFEAIPTELLLKEFGYVFRRYDSGEAEACPKIAIELNERNVMKRWIKRWTPQLVEHLRNIMSQRTLGKPTSARSVGGFQGGQTTLRVRVPKSNIPSK